MKVHLSFFQVFEISRVDANSDPVDASHFKFQASRNHICKGAFRGRMWVVFFSPGMNLLFPSLVFALSRAIS
jgi:hypothetical protein